MTRAALLLAIVCAMTIPEAALGQSTSSAADSPPVMLVVDISGSMDDDDGAGTRKIEGAKLALLDYLGSVEPGVQLGLHTYPDQGSAQDCNGGRAVIDVGPADPESMSAKIRALEPDGDTPTAEALHNAVGELDRSADSGTLVLVSDGESTCGDPCKEAKKIAGKGFDLDAITVGFQISDEGREELECISSAFGGRYLDIEESDELRDTLDRLGRPQIEVSLDESTIRTVAGGDYADVAATVTNTGEVEARDVIGQLDFSQRSAGGAPARASGIDVRRPVARLGNLAPQASQRVVWRVRAGPATAGNSFRFAAVGRAINASATGRAEGTLTSAGVGKLSEAGAILKGPGKGIAILGDSYSAGEGAGAYIYPTDSERNGCHRTSRTYLAPLYPESDVALLACSGAVTAEVWGPPALDIRDAQVDKLAERQKRQGPVGAVAMTIGGNDARFGPLAKSCILGRRSCTERIFPNIVNPFSSDSTEEFTRDAFTDLETSLKLTYSWVNRSLNGSEAFSKRGGAAPILVLGYPIPVPLTGRTCAPMGSYVTKVGTGPVTVSKTNYLLTAGEIDFIVSFAVRLNSIVEAAVENSRRDEGVPVFFVPTTEPAFQPRHTVCDKGKSGSATEPFGRAVDSFHGGALNSETLTRLASPSFSLAGGVFRNLKVSKTVLERGAQELAHPNQAGYAAETKAILRWSLSRAAADAARFTRATEAAKPAPTSWNVGDVNLGQLDGDTIQLQGGSSYPLTVGGFAPDTRLEVVVRSSRRVLADTVSDARGRLDTRVAIPRDLEDGDHTVLVAGTDPGGGSRTVRIPFEIDKPFRPRLPVAMGALSAGSLLLGFGLLGGTGRLARWRRWWRGRDQED